MSNRRFEMYDIRQVIQRLRLGESDRDVARAQRVGRKTVARVRRQAFERGWLDPKTPPPEDRELAEVFASAPTNRSVSSAAPFQEQILAWHGQGITATAIQQALARKYRFTGSVHTIYRLLDRVVDSSPPATVILDFAVAEAAQVDFGQGPQIIDRDRRGHEDLVFCHDARLEPSPIRRACAQPEGGDVARLPSPRLRVVQWRPGSLDHR